MQIPTSNDAAKHSVLEVQVVCALVQDVELRSTTLLLSF